MASTVLFLQTIELDPTTDAYPICQQWASAWESDFGSRFGSWTIAPSASDVALGDQNLTVSFKAEITVLTPGGNDSSADPQPSHVDVTNSTGRSAYWEWKVGGTNASDVSTWSHEMGHWMGLVDEYMDPVVYPWHLSEPADSATALMCWGTDVKKRYIQDIVDHADLSGHLLGGEYTVQ
jgi:hypothetical protein